MGTVEALKSKALARIEERRAEIIALAKAVLQVPETGFKEFQPSRLVLEKLQDLGVPC